MQYTVLGADDEVEILDSLELFLNKEGIRLIKADNGISALELFKSENPQMVLLDVMMPGIDGFGVLYHYLFARPQADAVVYGTFVACILVYGPEDIEHALVR